MTSLYVGQMAPSSFITNPASFQAGDEMRRVQRIAYWTKVLANAHGDDIATTSAARDPWLDDPAWQPFREAVERLLVAYDWGEAFTALNLAVKPVVDALLDEQLAELAGRNGDQFLALMFAEFGNDAARSREWSRALVRYALARRPELRDVLSGWLATWTPRAEAIAAGLAPLYETAPAPMKASEIVDAVQARHAELLESCGL
jgi:toluene monooxygenase system protein E